MSIIPIYEDLDAAACEFISLAIANAKYLQIDWHETTEAEPTGELGEHMNPYDLISRAMPKGSEQHLALEKAILEEERIIVDYSALAWGMAYLMRRNAGKPTYFEAELRVQRRKARHK